MKKLSKKLSVIALLMVLVTSFTCISAPIVTAQSYDQDLNDGAYKFDETLYQGDQIRAYVYPYDDDGNGSIYVDFRNLGEVKLKIDLFDTEDHTNVYRKFVTDRHVIIDTYDLNPDHIYRVIIENVSSPSTNVYGSIC